MQKLLALGGMQPVVVKTANAAVMFVESVTAQQRLLCLVCIYSAPIAIGQTPVRCQTVGRPLPGPIYPRRPFAPPRHQIHTGATVLKLVRSLIS